MDLMAEESSSPSPTPHPPPYVISEFDQRGLVVVITVTVLAFVWTCFLIRVFLRYKTREWKIDDWFLASATLLNTAQSAVVIAGVKHGLGLAGKDVLETQLVQIGQNELASQILYILTLLLSKCAVLFLYIRLSPERRHHQATHLVTGICSLWSLLAILLVSIPCNFIQFWRNSQENNAICPQLFPRNIFLTIFDTFTEVAIFLIPIYIIIHLRMRPKHKLTVLLAFSARLPVIAASAVRLYYLRAMLPAGADRTLEAAFFVVATQWHVGYAIMSTTITSLGPFLRPFANSFSYNRSAYGQRHVGDSSGERGAASGGGLAGGGVGGSSSLSGRTGGSGLRGLGSLTAKTTRGPRWSRRASSPAADSYALEPIAHNGAEFSKTGPASEASLRDEASGERKTGDALGPWADDAVNCQSSQGERGSGDSQHWMIRKRVDVTVDTRRTSDISRR